MTLEILELNYWLSLGTLVLEVATVFWIGYYFYLRSDRENAIKFIQPLIIISEKMWGSVEKNILVKIFVLSTLSSALTLYYSEVLGVIPCALCWFERVFMYGIVVISGVSLFAKNNSERIGIFRYIITFSVFGALISFYHHSLQLLATIGTNLPCPAGGAECSKRIIFEFGHITFPWMAFVIFILIILSLIIVREIQKE